MSQSQLLSRVIAVLNAHQIDYMVTGSLVSSSQGAPRATHDIDLVARIEPTSVPQLVSAFPAPEHYRGALSALEAIQRGDMFNLMASGSP